ncbi:hypothetical protein [Xenorhabdus koppenhoeferi]|uniref:Uncharacterized protein n=1 Tax=Xenorhabdus koppenhoeferi TaxID=351659 RepID=A0A1I7KNT6_9GAMM|nr:hypothetical protein [Xenorhabdus koppenhoeferi]SFU99070.1 hypothetical protein SAMN05421784_1883 [Xenorhabdus koppenhoeferi]
MDKLFYAVCDNDGICNFTNDKYQTLKAIFYEKEQAELLVSNNKDSLLIIVPIYIDDARGE